MNITCQQSIIHNEVLIEKHIPEDLTVLQAHVTPEAPKAPKVQGNPIDHVVQEVVREFINLIAKQFKNKLSFLSHFNLDLRNAMLEVFLYKIIHQKHHQLGKQLDNRQEIVHRNQHSSHNKDNKPHKQKKYCIHNQQNHKKLNKEKIELSLHIQKGS